MSPSVIKYLQMLVMVGSHIILEVLRAFADHRVHLLKFLDSCKECLTPKMPCIKSGGSEWTILEPGVGRAVWLF